MEAERLRRLDALWTPSVVLVLGVLTVVGIAVIPRAPLASLAVFAVAAVHDLALAMNWRDAAKTFFGLARQYGRTRLVHRPPAPNRWTVKKFRRAVTVSLVLKLLLIVLAIFSAL